MCQATEARVYLFIIYGKFSCFFHSDSELPGHRPAYASNQGRIFLGTTEKPRVLVRLFGMTAMPGRLEEWQSPGMAVKGDVEDPGS